MLYANDNLSTMTGAVRSHKPNCPPSLVETWINWRMRQIFNMRPYWAGGIQRGVLPIPAAYNTGTVTATLGDDEIVGVGTSWPTNDVVSTTLTSPISQLGMQVVTPASMTGIVQDTYLYIDAAGTPETVYVTSTNATSFRASFSQYHNNSATATCSSLAGRTMRLGYQIPNFIITAVTSSTTLNIELPYGGATLSGTGYTIVKNLYTFAPNMKELMSVVDPVQGLSLTINYPLVNLNREDPQRSSVNFPQYVCPHSMSPAGSALFELWPTPTQQRQMYFEYYLQPQDLKAPGDQPPPYIDPSVLIAGAIADALRTKIDENDPYVDPNGAEFWEKRFLYGIENLVVADNNLFNQQYSWRSGSWGYPSGANYQQSHDFDIYMQDY